MESKDIEIIDEDSPVPSPSLENAVEEVEVETPEKDDSCFDPSMPKECTPEPELTETHVEAMTAKSITIGCSELFPITIKVDDDDPMIKLKSVETNSESFANTRKRKAENNEEQKEAENNEEQKESENNEEQESHEEQKEAENNEEQENYEGEKEAENDYEQSVSKKHKLCDSSDLEFPDMFCDDHCHNVHGG